MRILTVEDKYRGSFYNRKSQEPESVHRYTINKLAITDLNLNLDFNSSSCATLCSDVRTHACLLKGIKLQKT